MFHYMKILSCLLFLFVETNAIPLEGSENAPNLFNLNGLAENSAPGATFIEGDIAIQLGGRAAYTRTPKWPNGTVPYEIDPRYTTQQMNVIRGAMQQIMNNTSNCIRFVLRSDSSRAWLKIFPGRGCWSYMGKARRRGAQNLSLQIPSCVHASVALHELLHALGFVHEQSRSDRDAYVRINYGNVQPGRENNFNKYSATDANTLNEPYDYRSIMHYRTNAFSSNGRPTIEPIDDDGKSTQNIIGRSDTMSKLDIKKLKKTL